MRYGRLQFGYLHTGHFTQFLILFGCQNLFGTCKVIERGAVFFAGVDDRFELFVLLVQRDEFPDVGDYFRIGHLLTDLFIFDFQAIEA